MAACADPCPWDASLLCEHTAGHTTPDPRYPRAALHQARNVRWADHCHFPGDDCGPAHQPQLDQQPEEASA